MWHPSDTPNIANKKELGVYQAPSYCAVVLSFSSLCHKWRRAVLDSLSIPIVSLCFDGIPLPGEPDVMPLEPVMNFEPW